MPSSFRKKDSRDISHSNTTKNTKMSDKNSSIVSPLLALRNGSLK